MLPSLNKGFIIIIIIIISAAQLRYVTEIAPKSPFLSVNRSHFRAGKREIPYSVNTESVAEPSWFFFLIFF